MSERLSGRAPWWAIPAMYAFTAALGGSALASFYYGNYWAGGILTALTVVAGGAGIPSAHAVRRGE